MKPEESFVRHQPCGDRFGIMPLYNALHVNRWKQPEMERQAGDFLKTKRPEYAGAYLHERFMEIVRGL